MRGQASAKPRIPDSRFVAKIGRIPISVRTSPWPPHSPKHFARRSLDYSSLIRHFSVHPDYFLLVVQDSLHFSSPLGHLVRLLPPGPSW